MHLGRRQQKAGELDEYMVSKGQGHGWTVLDYMAKLEAFVTKYVSER